MMRYTQLRQSQLFRSTCFAPTLGGLILLWQIRLAPLLQFHLVVQDASPLLHTLLDMLALTVMMRRNDFFFFSPLFLVLDAKGGEN
jgi:hypothetical protein